MALRKEGWEKLLDEYITSTALREFKWGECDCLIFASDACKLINGIDPMSYKKKGDPKTIRGAYATKEEAYLLIKKYRKTIKGVMDIHFERVPAMFAQRGDIVLHNKAFGVVMSGKAFFKMETKGFLALEITDGMTAWHI